MAERRTPLASTYDMQHRLVSSSVWSIIVFLINGVVFVLLGMQLPNALSPSVTAAGFTPGILVAYVLVLTALSVAVRFVWVAAMELLQPGGMLLVCCYPGHAEGQRELDALRDLFTAVPPQAFNILEHRFLNGEPQAAQAFLRREHPHQHGALPQAGPR